MNGLAFLGLWFCSAFVTFAVWFLIDTRLDNAAAARRARRHLANLTEADDTRGGVR